MEPVIIPPEALPQAPPRRQALDPEALTRALRIAGAALVVASASTFMLQHWQSGNDIGRYAMLVGQSILLAAAAYFVGLTVREGRSARTFLALVLGTIPVSFTVLGGLVYSRFHLEALSPLPHYASWVAPNDLSVLFAFVGTLVVLVPLAVASMVALARGQARALTLAFTASNLLLLVPARAPALMVGVAGLALVGLFQLDLSRFSRAARLDTLEGKLARVMPFLPPLIMLGRAVHLYEVPTAFVGGCCLLAATALFQLSSRVTNAHGREACGWFSGVGAVLGWGLCWLDLAAHVHSAAFAVLLLGLPSAGLLLVASLRADGARPSIAGAGTLLGLGTVVLASAFDLGTGAALCAILLGTVVAVGGAGFGSWPWALIGSSVALYGLGVQVWLAVHADNLLRWASLSLVGVLLIVGAAYVERHRARVARAWDALTRHLPQAQA
jgi:hypothetical protein